MFRGFVEAALVRHAKGAEPKLSAVSV